MQKRSRAEIIAPLSYIQRQKYRKNRLCLFFFLCNSSTVTWWNSRSFKGYVHVNFVIVMNSFFPGKNLQEIEIKFLTLCVWERETFTPSLSYNWEYISMCMFEYYKYIYIYLCINVIYTHIRYTYMIAITYICVHI